MRRCVALIAVVAGVLALPPAAGAHPERSVEFPAGTGTFPKIRHSGPSRVVCKPDSAQRIRRLSGAVRASNLALLERCRYRHIQAAVNAAGSGERILILPGVYREEPSRRVPNPDPICAAFYEDANGRPGRPTPSYEYEVRCPNSRNLVAIIGDSLSDPDRRCDQKCNLQIQGTGARPTDVRVIGVRSKQNVFKADRADGIVFYNLSAEVSDYNNFYVIETDGFRYDRIVSRWSNEYGFLSFVSDHGIYEDLEAYGAGDAGIYPGSGPQHRCGILIRRVNSHHNLQGNSGSAGDGLCYRDNRFHHNGAGVVVDSFSRGHPGSPQDSSRWIGNRIYSNNQDYFKADRDRYCKRPYLQRDPSIVCPAIMVPIGTGLLIAGGNDNLVARNQIYDNRRYGVMLFQVPAGIRGEDDPAKQDDTSHGNRFVGNVMGVRPSSRGGDFAGISAPNGTDFWWTGQGERNCWQDNRGFGGRPVTGDPSRLPGCPGSSVRLSGDGDKFASLIACAAWDPETNTDPPGCDWFVLPPRRR